jgi:hypothetical protein
VMGSRNRLHGIISQNSRLLEFFSVTLGALSYSTQLNSGNDVFLPHPSHSSFSALLILS